ncbi:MAG: hypothetical protein II090_03795, partial [Elusimicrobia bacterium]|nr:hypothetical protein [Elusimicrobiota bacterium]
KIILKSWKFNIETVDAEIKIRNALTASLGGEKQAVSSLLNGPQRVQSKRVMFTLEYSATGRHPLVAGDMLVS